MLIGYRQNRWGRGRAGQVERGSRPESPEQEIKKESQPEV
jgi:hypothetical protein